MDSITRRNLVKGAVGATVAWSAPLVVAERAWAGLIGTPKCVPPVTVECLRYYCNQGGKWFPGIKITAGNCPCGTNPTGALGYVKPIGNPTSTGETTMLFYPGTTDCGPNCAAGHCDPVSSGGCAVIGAGGNQYYFGPPRASANGAIPNFNSGTITFTFCVFVGPCQRPGGQPSYLCQRYTMSAYWNASSSVDNWTTTCTPTAIAGTCGCEDGTSPC